MSLLDEITDVPIENLMSLTQHMMAGLFGVVANALESVTFPLELNVTDMTGYCLQMTMPDPESWPQIIAVHDPFNLGDRRFLCPFDLAVHDAEGRSTRISVVTDIFERKISLIRHNTLLVQ